MFFILNFTILTLPYMIREIKETDYPRLIEI